VVVVAIVSSKSTMMRFSYAMFNCVYYYISLADKSFVKVVLKKGSSDTPN